jgi:hypothetical protein
MLSLLPKLMLPKQKATSNLFQLVLSLEKYSIEDFMSAKSLAGSMPVKFSIRDLNSFDPQPTSNTDSFALIFSANVHPE